VKEENPFAEIIGKRLRADRLLLKKHMHDLGDNFYCSLIERLESGRELTEKQREAVRNSEKR
jgi:hypothetical protein